MPGRSSLHPLSTLSLRFLLTVHQLQPSLLLTRHFKVFTHPVSFHIPTFLVSFLCTYHRNQPKHVPTDLSSRVTVPLSLTCVYVLVTKRLGWWISF